MNFEPGEKLIFVMVEGRTYHNASRGESQHRKREFLHTCEFIEPCGEKSAVVKMHNGKIEKKLIRKLRKLEE